MSEPWIGEMDAADRTRALARAGWAVDRQYVCLAIEDAERRARARALEEAAMVALDVAKSQADGWYKNPGEPTTNSAGIAASNTGFFTAVALRSLADPQP